MDAPPQQASRCMLGHCWPVASTEETASWYAVWKEFTRVAYVVREPNAAYETIKIELIGADIIFHSQCDYTNVPTVVLTPLEYAACGLSEEKANLTFGEDSVEVITHTHTYILKQTGSKIKNVCPFAGVSQLLLATGVGTSCQE